MAAIKEKIGNGPTPDPYDDIYAIPGVEKLTPDQKGDYLMIGLWRHEAGTNRGSMVQALFRLFSYVQKNQRYPDEFRYGPGHPPPLHRLRVQPRSSSEASASDSDAPPSDVDRLFAKLIPAQTHSAPPEPEPKVTVDSLFAKLTQPAPVAPAPPTTGISLLDNIFASAVPIHQPTPSVSVLNQDVMNTLLGLPPSRTASAASNTLSTTSRDGDNEEDSDSSGQGSAPSGLLTVPSQGKVKGDVTPRGLPIKGVPVPSVLEAASSISTVRGMPVDTPPTKKPLSNRQLVPFEDDSELWPYAPNNAAQADDDDEIMELDFGETSLLSDPDALSGKKKAPAKRVRTKRKSKKERDAQEREEIEKSWDVPSYTQSYVAAQRAAAEARKEFLNSPPASPSPPRTPPAALPSQQNGQSGLDAQTPTMGAKRYATGTTSTAVPITPSKGKSAVKGPSHESGVDKELVKNGIIETLQAQSRNFGPLERNAFVREVLTLIHVCLLFDLYVEAC